MNAKEANKIPIGSYLKHLGIKPSKVTGSYSFYLSPYRNERTPSFKVSHAKNLWVDYGDSNAGGTLIDLVLKINPSYSISEAIKEVSDIGGHSFSFHKPDSNLIQPLNKDETSGISIIKIKPLGNNRAVTDYLHSRCISLDTAKDFCKEVYYNIGDKRYFGVGNEHENGWAIRNKYWKGCTAQGISHYLNRSDELCLFEGIFDLMSYVEMKKENKYKEDYMVLNSLANLKTAIPKIQKYKQVLLYLDRDKVGREATDSLVRLLPQCEDKGGFIQPCKDLNEFWKKEYRKSLYLKIGYIKKINLLPISEVTKLFINGKI